MSKRRPSTSVPAIPDIPWTVIVADRGFVFVGQPVRVGDKVQILNCYNIRRWSVNTKDGIGGLSLRGPTTDNDTLDRWPGVARVHIIGIVAELECENQEAWSAWHMKASK